MSKLLLILSIAVSAPFISTAQKIKFTDTANVWHEQGMWIEVPGGGYLFEKYYYDGDTVINGNQYLKMFDYHCSQSIPTQTNQHPLRFCETKQVGFTREDAAGLVYYAHYAGSVLQEDTLYNYNLQLNDTFTSAGYQSKVIGLDSVMISGVYHKVWEFEYIIAPVNTKAKYKVLEGIGGLSGMFRPTDMKGTKLVCFRQGMASPSLGKAIDGFDNANSCTLGIKENAAIKTNKPAIVPHPANSGSYIQFPNRFTGTISIYNNTGQLIVNEKISNAERWQLQNKLQVPGMYFYSINAENQVFTGTFIYE